MTTGRFLFYLNKAAIISRAENIFATMNLEHSLKYLTTFIIFSTYTQDENQIPAVTVL